MGCGSSSSEDKDERYRTGKNLVKALANRDHHSPHAHRHHHDRYTQVPQVVEEVTSSYLCGLFVEGRTGELEPEDPSSTSLRQNRVLVIRQNEIDDWREWGLTEEERCKLYSAVDGAGADGKKDGSVTPGELTWMINAIKDEHSRKIEAGDKAAENAFETRVNISDMDLFTHDKNPAGALFNPAIIEDGWDTIDTDGSGTISLEEWHAFVYACMLIKLQFLERESHLQFKCFWGYGCYDSYFPTPHAFWDESRAGTENYTVKRLPFLCYAKVTPAWCSDFWYFLCQNHELFSILFVDEDHPLDKWERRSMELFMVGYTFMMTGARNFIQAFRVASEFPGACAAKVAEKGLLACAEHNCLCRPGHVLHCQNLYCTADDYHQIHNECHDYGVVNASRPLCRDGYTWADYALWPPVYLLVFVTVPSIIMGKILYLVFASPCTVIDETDHRYKPHFCVKCCDKMQKVWVVLVAFVSIFFWSFGFYLSFSEAFTQLLALVWPDADHLVTHDSWVEDHETQFLLFIWGRLQTYIVSFVMLFLFQFNFFVGHYEDSKEEDRGKDWKPSDDWKYHWWANPEGYVGCLLVNFMSIGQWHRERLEFEDKDYKLKEQRRDHLFGNIHSRHPSSSMRLQKEWDSLKEDFAARPCPRKDGKKDSDYGTHGIYTNIDALTLSFAESPEKDAEKGTAASPKRSASPRRSASPKKAKPGAKKSASPKKAKPGAKATPKAGAKAKPGSKKTQR